jgi:hypothetical protein
LSSLVTLRVTLVYAATLAIVATTLLALGPRAHNSVVARMSTNVDNLARGHLDTLVASAFVTDGGQIYLWLPGLVCLLAVAELLWRSSRVVAALALGHIGATLIVAAGLALAIEMRWLPIDTASASDVGISYGAAGVLGALTAAIPPGWRAAWTGWWVASVVLVAAVAQDFTSVGHALALMLGILLSGRLGLPARWTPTRLGLLVAGSWFGYLTLAGSAVPTAPIAGLAGAAAAVIAHAVITRRRGQTFAGEPAQ